MATSTLPDLATLKDLEASLLDGPQSTYLHNAFQTGPKGVLSDSTSNPSGGFKASQTGPKGVLSDYNDARKTSRTGVKGVLEDWKRGDSLDGNPSPSFWTARPSSRLLNRDDDDDEEQREPSSEEEEEFRRPGKARTAGVGVGNGVWDGSHVGMVGKRTVDLKAKSYTLDGEVEDEGTEEEEEDEGGVFEEKRSHLRHVTELSLLKRIDDGGKIVLCIYDQSDYSTSLLSILAVRIRSSSLISGFKSNVSFLRLPSIALSREALGLSNLTDPDLLPCLVCYDRGEVVGSEFRIGVDVEEEGGAKKELDRILKGWGC